MQELAKAKFPSAIKFHTAAAYYFLHFMLNYLDTK